MWWRDVLLSLLCLAHLGESTDRLARFRSANLGAETSLLYKWTVTSAGFFVAVALVLSMFLIFEHLAGGTKIFGWSDSNGSRLCSGIGNNSDEHISCLACGEESTIEFMENKNWITSSVPLIDETYAYGFVEHPFPLNCCLRDWKLGSDFYQGVKIGIVQYMILKMICALLSMLFQSLGVYGEGKFEWGYAYPYLAVVLNFSQTWALYCLVQFYSVTKNKLEPIKPLAKFLTFKSIVFLTWWQGVAVAFLFSFGALQGSLALVLKTRIQDYIICIEMGVAALVHLYVFPATPYKRGERCVRNVSLLADYAALGTPPDPEEVQDSERSSKVRFSRQEDTAKTPKLHQSVRDVVIGSGEIIADGMRFTVSHVVEPVERGLAKINKTFHQISENVKRYEDRRKSSKDDTHLVPLNSGTKEFARKPCSRQFE